MALKTAVDHLYLLIKSNLSFAIQDNLTTNQKEMLQLIAEVYSRDPKLGRELELTFGKCLKEAK